MCKEWDTTPMARFSRLDVLVVTLRSGVMPLFFSPDPTTAIHVVDALAAAGVRTIEFTNRGDGAHLVFAELERECRRRLPEVVLGIGSVFDAGTAALYLNLGASFVVSPTLSPEVAAVCNRRKVAYMPGCATPTEVARAEELGCEIVKLFPARLGGPKLVSDILAPCPWSRLMPTGGIAPDRESLTAWFTAGAACVGLGSQLFPADDVSAGRWDVITERAHSALDLVTECRPPLQEQWA
jgi:2-dehydro-3-deoxyphosphogluconate aldolase/(4S)-4-hydroxy-2-oxoglutarate aldolase